MADYIGVPLETDSSDLVEQMFDDLESSVPGWVPSDGNVDVRLMNAFAGIAAETRDLASTVPDTIFAQFGSAFLNLPQLQGSFAQMSSTWAARDATGYTIPQGTLVQGTDSSGNVLFWSVYQDYVIPPASTTVAGVLLQALNIGAAADGISYLAGQIVLVDDLEFISTVTANTASAGGVDAEADDAYLNRLKNELQTLAPTPILPGDFSILALNISGIGRAVTIDGYDYTANTYSNARTVTVYVLDANGGDPGSTIRGQVSAYLESLREVNWTVFVTTPSPSSIDVVYTVKGNAGFDPSQLLIDINAALDNFFNPVNWGTPDLGESPNWVNKDHVYFFEVAAVIQDVVGVDHLISMTVDGGTTDVALTGSGPVGITEAGTMTGTIT